MCNDSTERGRQDYDLRVSETRYRRLFETAQDGILLLDADSGQITDVNPFLIDIMGFSKEDFLNKRLWDIGLFKDDEKSRNLFLELQNKGYVRYDNLPLSTRDGRSIDVEFVSNVYPVDGKNVIQCNVRDITERKRVEEGLRDELEQKIQELAKKTEDLTRSNVELEQFAYVASHDLQEPLRIVTSYAQHLEKRYKGKLDPEADEFIEFIVDGTRRMEGLIKGLLAFSRVGTRGKPFELLETEAVLKVVLQNLRLAIEDNKGRVTHDTLPAIVADETQIMELFQNLIANGLKFHGEDSPIVHISARREEKGWTFSFKDNGIGIDPQHYSKLFSIFQRLNPRDYPGTGIGLAVSKKIVERHGGHIWVDSVPGKGATFYFFIPDRDESAADGNRSR